MTIVERSKARAVVLIWHNIFPVYMRLRIYKIKMAAAWRTFGKQFVRRISSHYVSVEQKSLRPKRFPILLACGSAAGSAVVWYAYKKNRYMPAMSIPKVSRLSYHDHNHNIIKPKRF